MDKVMSYVSLFFDNLYCNLFNFIVSFFKCNYRNVLNLFLFDLKDNYSEYDYIAFIGDNNSF